MSLSIDDLKSMGISIPEEEKTVDINISRPTKNVSDETLKEVNPAEMLGLKYQREIDQEDPNLRPREEKVFGDADDAISRKIREVQEIQDIYDQTGEITDEDLNDVIGFDPEALLKNPPKPGRVKMESIGIPEEEKQKMLQEQNKIEKINSQKEIHYENDDIDEDELLEKEIMDAIPDDDEIVTVADKGYTGTNDKGYEGTPGIDELTKDTSVEEVSEPVKAVPVSNVKNDIDIDRPTNNSDVVPKIPEDRMDIERSEDDDLLELLEDEQKSDTNEDEIFNKRMELLKKDVKEKIHTNSIVDIKGFTISTKPISVNNTIEHSKFLKKGTADWPLMYSNRCCTMSEFKGEEIQILTRQNQSRNKVNSVKQIYNVFYDHIVDPYKPDTLEQWAKVTSVLDVENLYANAYFASFEGKNFLPYDCGNKKCNHSFLTNDVPFMDMVKFKNTKSKERFNKILNTPPSPKHKVYSSNVIPVSSVYAMGFKEPSIYDVVFVSAYLDDAFISKYQDIISIAPYIDKVYFIEPATMSLRPLNIKEFPNDIVKTIKAKIITLSKIIKDFSSDEYNMINVYASETAGDVDDVTFILPETHCPKCGELIKETEYSSSELLFIRHHLTSLVTG